MKGDLLKLLVLILDICASFVLTGIALSKHKKESGSDVTGEAIASVVVFGGVGIVYIVIIIGYYIYILCSREEPFKCSEILREHGQGMLIAIGGLCYYFGDNLPPLLRNYEGVIGITQGWVEGIQVAGIVALGAATVTYLRVLIDGALKNKESKKEMPMHTSEEATELIPETETVQKENTEEDKTPAHVVVLLLLAKATIWTLCTQLSKELHPTNATRVLLVVHGHTMQSISLLSLLFAYQLINEYEKTKESTTHNQ